MVLKRRHQNGRWPLNLLHREHIELEMETDVGGASRWNTLRALRVLPGSALDDLVVRSALLVGDQV
jgi:hypothetical protein